MIVEPLAVNDEYTICGGDIGPSSLFVWHFLEEDCRAIREPLEGPTVVVPEGITEDEAWCSL